jgi:ABC-type uncharacterized transport system, periplasmic component
VERYAEGRQERLPELAVELVRLEVDVLVATTSAAVQAAMNATRTIPIVMAGGGDPVGLGFVASLARPGGNVTGPSMMNTEIVGKRMQLLKEVVPGLVRVAVLSNSVNPIHAIFWRETEPAARELGLELQPSKRAYRRISRRHSRQPREARLGRSSPSMMRSHITTEPGWLRWPPQVDFRHCMVIANFPTRGA